MVSDLREESTIFCQLLSIVRVSCLVVSKEQCLVSSGSILGLECSGRPGLREAFLPDLCVTTKDVIFFSKQVNNGGAKF